MDTPALVIMAAGMGSRYGGLKQIDPVDGQGDILMDFSIYDARQAGFRKVVFIIKKENEQAFKEAVGDRISKYMEVVYVFQELDALPEGAVLPKGRVRPFGTGHAVLCCMDVLDGPFAVINADDYYGRQAFEQIYKFLTDHSDDEKYRWCMVGYVLGNTLTDHGHVSRGVCRIDDRGYLQGIQELTHIEKRPGGAVYTEDGGAVWKDIDVDSVVSMNMWGFSRSILKELKERFPKFLERGLKADPLKCEYFLPAVVGELLAEGKATVEVLKSMDQWYGVTYQEDKEAVTAAIGQMKEAGIYPKIALH